MLTSFSFLEQEGVFHLHVTYIIENIISMVFPAGNLSSGIFAYVEVSVLKKMQILLIGYYFLTYGSPPFYH